MSGRRALRNAANGPPGTLPHMGSRGTFGGFRGGSRGFRGGSSRAFSMVPGQDNRQLDFFGGDGYPDNPMVNQHGGGGQSPFYNDPSMAPFSATRGLMGRNAFQPPNRRGMPRRGAAAFPSGSHAMPGGPFQNTHSTNNGLPYNGEVNNNMDARRDHFGNNTQVGRVLGGRHGNNHSFSSNNGQYNPFAEEDHSMADTGMHQSANGWGMNSGRSRVRGGHLSLPGRSRGRGGHLSSSDPFGMARGSHLGTAYGSPEHEDGSYHGMSETGYGMNNHLNNGQPQER